MAYAIGVTGGIGCGKTTATNYFKEKGITVIDTDEISHDLTKPFAIGTMRIKEEFGEQFVSEDGILNRPLLREAVFSDVKQKNKLEAILHPMIRDEVQKQFRVSKSAYTLIVVPLLFETKAYVNVVQRILVIDCPKEQQIQRVMKRSDFTREQVLAIMAHQVSREERIQKAHDILNNNTDILSLHQQIDILHQRYLTLAVDKF